MSSKVPRNARKQKPEGVNETDRNIYVSLVETLNVPYVVARGSRVEGFWEDDSDYDVTVPLAPHPDIHSICRDHGQRAGVKWDVAFGNASLIEEWNRRAGRTVAQIIRRAA